MVRLIGAALAALPLLLASTAQAKPGRGEAAASGISPGRQFARVGPFARSPAPRLPRTRSAAADLPPATVAPPSARLPISFVGDGNVAVNAWSPAPSMSVGVGLYRVPKAERLDRARSPWGETPTHNVPAVGLSLSF